MIFEIVVGGILLGTFIYHRWIEDHPGLAIDSVRVPRVDEGAPVPLVYGRCRVRAPIIAWAGGQRRLPVGRDDTEIPHTGDAPAYFLDMLYVVGIPFYNGVGELLNIYAGDTFVTVSPASSYTGLQFPLDTPGNDGGVLTLPIFGGASVGRHSYWAINPLGLEFRLPDQFIADLWEPACYFGFVEFLDGNPDQVISDGVDDVYSARPDGSLTDIQGVLEVKPMNGIYNYWKDDISGFVAPDPLDPDILASHIPAYRGFMMACLYRWCNGASTSQPTYGFEVRVQSAMFSPILGDDADPAAVIYDLLTSPWSKLGLSVDRVDVDSFQAASTTLRAEANGYSRVFDEVATATDMIGEVLRHIDGILYEEPTTGKLVLKLVRNDYTVGGLVNLNPDNARPAGAGWYQVQGWAETINQVRLKFRDRANAYSEAIVVAQNAANVVGQDGRLRSIDLDFPGCCDRALAQILASRELAVVSRPMVRASVGNVNRSFATTRPGDVLSFTWPELGVNAMVMRVARVDLGTKSSGAITLDLIRDVFDVTLGAYPPPI